MMVTYFCEINEFKYNLNFKWNIVGFDVLIYLFFKNLFYIFIVFLNKIDWET